MNSRTKNRQTPHLLTNNESLPAPCQFRQSMYFPPFSLPIVIVPAQRSMHSPHTTIQHTPPGCLEPPTPCHGLCPDLRYYSPLLAYPHTRYHPYVRSTIGHRPEDLKLRIKKKKKKSSNVSCLGHDNVGPHGHHNHQCANTGSK